VLRCLNPDDELTEELLMWANTHRSFPYSKLIASKMPVYRFIESLQGSSTIPDDFCRLIWTALDEEVE
jgi:hypothetical protein